MAFSYSRSGRLYLKTQSDIMTAATLAGANCCRNSGVTITPNNPRSPRNDKTGTLSPTPGIGGLRSCSVDVKMDLAANGAPGIVPDCDPILQSLFGAASTIVATTSVTYSLSDATVPVTVGHFRTPSSVQQQIAWGVNFEQAQWGFNDGVVSKWSASGKGVWAPDSKTFSALDTIGKGGISSFPAEPGSPVTNGNVVSAFTGSLTLDSTAIATVKSGSLRFSRPIELEHSYGTGYATSASPGLRNIQLSLQLWDDDSAYMTDLLTHGIQDSVIGATLVMGSVAGNIWTWTVKGLQLTPPKLDDGQQRWVADFGSSMATASSVAATDELSLVIT